jgi:hypothetical protein
MIILMTVKGGRPNIKIKNETKITI